MKNPRFFGHFEGIADANMYFSWVFGGLRVPLVSGRVLVILLHAQLLSDLTRFFPFLTFYC